MLVVSSDDDLLGKPKLAQSFTVRPDTREESSSASSVEDLL